MKSGEGHRQRKLGKEQSNVGVVILSRYNSSRLPGKALKEIEGKPVLQYIVERVNEVFPLNKITIATSDEITDDPIAAFALTMKVTCYRGSLENVAQRFFQAGKTKAWDYIVRVNGDNIFLDIPLLQHVKALSERGVYDFISNVKNRTYPKGMSVESVRTDYYEQLLPKIDSSSYYKEHVTIYLYEHDSHQNFCYLYNKQLPEAAGLQMALDTAEDLERTTLIFRKLEEDHRQYNLKELIKLMED